MDDPISKVFLDSKTHWENEKDSISVVGFIQSEWGAMGTRNDLVSRSWEQSSANSQKEMGIFVLQSLGTKVSQQP